MWRTTIISSRFSLYSWGDIIQNPAHRVPRYIKHTVQRYVQVDIFRDLRNRCHKIFTTTFMWGKSWISGSTTKLVQKGNVISQRVLKHGCYKPKWYSEYWQCNIPSHPVNLKRHNRQRRSCEGTTTLLSGSISHDHEFIFSNSRVVFMYLLCNVRFRSARHLLGRCYHVGALRFCGNLQTLLGCFYRVGCFL